jgi:hypothetical protein
VGRYSRTLRVRQRQRRLAQKTEVLVRTMPPMLACGHGRLEGQPCPWCMGTATRRLTEAEAMAITIKTSGGSMAVKSTPVWEQMERQARLSNGRLTCRRGAGATIELVDKATGKVERSVGDPDWVPLESEATCEP